MRFKRIFVCPSVSRGTFTLCRRLVAVDGTFLKARFILTLLLAVGIDANGELVPLAWAVVESENGESWGWFLNHLRWALPELVIEESTLVSDRDKGLREAERALGGRVVVAHCCHHLKENFTEKFGRALQPLFWAAARAKTRAAWDGALEKIRAKKPEAALYLEQAEPETWAEAWFRGRRFGHDTSNIAESLNQVLRIDRELPIVELLDAIWHRVMEKRGQRLLAATSAISEGRSTTPFVDARIEEGRELARSNRVQISSPTTGRVVQPDGTIHLVDTAAGTCSCRRYQCNGIPCGHAMTLIFAGGGQLAPFLPVTMSAAQWAAAYVVPLTPIDISELEVNAQDPCDPPITRVPRGRPRKERIRREDCRRPRRRDPLVVRSRCGTCGEAGHNARRCRQPHQ